jgi:hypothetical protein
MDLVSGSEHWFDTETGTNIVLNDTSVPTGEVISALSQQHPELAALSRWYSNTNSGVGSERRGGIFERDRYVTPKKISDHFKVAQDAAESDDVVSGVLESTEALAFSKMSIECDDLDEADIWNQIASDLNMDSLLRQAWRELFVVSQFYAAMVWGRKNYKVRGRTKDGNLRRREFNNLLVPLGVSFLDPLKVLPVGNFLFGQERLVYIADRMESTRFDEVLAGSNSSNLDPVVSQLFEKKYEPSREEKKFLQELTDANLDNLYYLNPKNVWRHTLTRPDYQRFATVRMLSVFELLDLKQQLRQQDRAYLIGATNFIVLVKKGSDQYPAKNSEIAGLARQVQTSARVPVIVGDHRLSVEIITPKMDSVMRPERYNTIDARITARLYQIFMCVDEETEALTHDGWKSHDELHEGDILLTLNTETNTSEWLPVDKVNRYDVENLEMHSMESGSISALTTQNHRWWVEQKLSEGSEWQWRRSDQLGFNSKIPLSFEHGNFPEQEIVPDSLVELIAWYWTEGTKRGNRVAISQSRTVNPDHCESIFAACKTMFGEPDKVSDGGLWYVYEHKNGSSIYQFCSELGEVFDLLAPNKLPSYDFLLSLTKDQLDLFIEKSIDADGCRSDRISFFQKNEDAIERFEFAAVLAGRSITKVKHNEDIWRVTLLKNKFVRPHHAAYQGSSRSSVGNKTYTGTVWCPSTSNMTFLARRNGKVYWTGNSGNYAAGAKGDDSIKLARVVARGMESRRHMLKRTLDLKLLGSIRDANPEFKFDAKLRFHPKRIALDFDNNVANYLQDLRDRGDISRETMLSELDINQADEALRRSREKNEYDDIFTPVIVPYSTPKGSDNQKDDDDTEDNVDGVAGNTKGVGRRKGGNKNGGGANPDSYRPNDDALLDEDFEDWE